MRRTISVFAIVLVLAGPTDLIAQNGEPLRTQFGRYIGPTFLGQISGFVIGIGTLQLLVYGEREERLDDIDYIRRFGFIFLSGQVGGIVGAATIAHDWKNVMLYSGAAHAAIVGGIFLISPELQYKPAIAVTAIYLWTAAVVTMATASIVDTSYAKNRARLTVLPNIVPQRDHTRVGLTVRISL